MWNSPEQRRNASNVKMKIILGSQAAAFPGSWIYGFVFWATLSPGGIEFWITLKAWQRCSCKKYEIILINEAVAWPGESMLESPRFVWKEYQERKSGWCYDWVSSGQGEPMLEYPRFVQPSKGKRTIHMLKESWGDAQWKEARTESAARSATLCGKSFRWQRSSCRSGPRHLPAVISITIQLK